MKVPKDERHNTISNTRVLHGDADIMYTPKSLLADSPEDCQCSPKSAFIVAFLLTVIYFTKGQTCCCARDFDLFSIFKKGWSTLPQKETKQLMFCIA